MRHKKISITERNSHMLCYNDFEDVEDNSREVERMKKILHKAISGELTDKQRYCLCEYYLNGRSMKNIATDLNVNPSTVTRHIQNAKRRLRRVASYY